MQSSLPTSVCVWMLHWIRAAPPTDLCSLGSGTKMSELYWSSKSWVVLKYSRHRDDYMETFVDSPCSHKKLQGDLVWHRGTKYSNHRQFGGTTCGRGPPMASKSLCTCTTTFVAMLYIFNLCIFTRHELHTRKHVVSTLTITHYTLKWKLNN